MQKGVANIARAIINIKEKDDYRGKSGDKELLVEGYGLQKCMTTDGEDEPSSVVSFFYSRAFLKV